MSITSSRRLPLSLPNVLLIGLSFAGAIVTMALGNWFGAFLLLILGGGGLLSAVLARREGASDWLRINAIEYRDERDARLAGHGFAVVGAWALVLATAELIAATIFVGAVTLSTSATSTGGSLGFTFTRDGIVAGSLEAIAAVQLLVLALVWGIANTRAVKRG
jgi:hypothetical protein